MKSLRGSKKNEWASSLRLEDKDECHEELIGSGEGEGRGKKQAGKARGQGEGLLKSRKGSKENEQVFCVWGKLIFFFLLFIEGMMHERSEVGCRS